jgi:hypothetical protein
VYHTLALGYAEPLRQYGLNKCRNDWVLILDTDEWISTEFKRGLYLLVSNEQVNGYYIRRYEYARRGSTKGFFTWQLRLYRKSCALNKGMIHEMPIVSGEVVRLTRKDHFMDHVREVQERDEYNKMFIFDSNPTYMLVARDLYISAKIRGVRSLLNPGKLINETLSNRGHQTEETREIARILEKEGVTRFLKLDKDETIRRLNSRYRNKRQGISLLIKLIFEQYRSTRIWKA